MRRLFWLAMGLGAGVAGAIMSTRFLRRQATKIAPANLAREARGGMMDLAKLFSESMAEGREAMREKERELLGAGGSEGPEDSAHDGSAGSGR